MATQLDTLQKELFNKMNTLALPKWMSKETMLKVFWNALLANPKLRQCSKESLIGALLKCVEWQLTPSMGKVWLVPFQNNRKPGNPLECQAIIGVRGLIELAKRVEKSTTIQAHIVREGDEFDYAFGTDPYIRHKPKLGNKGKIICVYAIWRTRSSFDFDVYDIETILKRRDTSRAYRRAELKGTKDSIWHIWPEEMIKKTAIRILSKTQQLSAELEKVFAEDEEMEFGEPISQAEVEIPQEVPQEMPQPTEQPLPERSDLEALDSHGEKTKQSAEPQSAKPSLKERLAQLQKQAEAKIKAQAKNQNVPQWKKEFQEHLAMYPEDIVLRVLSLFGYSTALEVKTEDEAFAIGEKLIEMAGGNV